MSQTIDQNVHLGSDDKGVKILQYISLFHECLDSLII